MKRITALPVTGEAYLLEYLGKRILVDGGYTGAALASALKKQLGETMIHMDIVVCTHSDIDHAGGLTSLLDQPDVKVAEFWLPGSWKEAILDLVENTEVFYKELIEEVKEGGSLKAISGDDPEKVDRELRKLTSDVTIPEVDVLIKEGRRLNLRPSSSDRKTTAAARAKQAIRKISKDGSVCLRAIDLIDTAERIRKIALSANDKRVPVRWFDYLTYSKHRNSSGGEHFLIPLNAKELLEPPALVGFKYRRFISLSRANRESLVYLSSGDDAHVEVLFCGDSPLGDGPKYTQSFLLGKSTKKPLIATVPHHGANSNAMAYGHIAGFGQVSFWIRAGGKSHHPESEYQKLPSNLRTCTHCPHNGLPLQAVCITDKCEEFCDPGAWLTVRSHDCMC